ncbi:MAG: AraC family transcriptional regulator, partial [Oscillospiraceae bacterium]|nr:AraC family transcriptional regulator [Oscillospiraceae bacterium]
MENYSQEFTLNNIYVRHAVDYEPDDACFEMHIHSRCEIFYFVAGRVECLVEGSKYPLERGSLVIMRPAESHRAKILKDNLYERYTINFPLSAADSIDPERILMKPFLDRPLGMGNLYLPTEFDGVPIENYFKRICSCNDKYAAEVEIQLCLLSVLDAIRTANTNRDVCQYPAEQTRPVRILKYINDHLFEKLSVPMLAERFYISVSQFNRIFKNATGSSPWEYITLKRLTAAKEKISNGAQVTKACAECGFDDYSVFYRAYVKYFG